MRSGEQFSPMRAGLEGSQPFLDQGQQCVDSRDVLLPGKMDSGRPLLIAGTHPQVVFFDATDLGDKEMRGYFFA